MRGRIPTPQEYRLNRLHERAADADRLEERLRRLEWSGRYVVEPCPGLLRRLFRPCQPVTGNCCPVCQRTPYTGHEGTCWLGLELRPHVPGR